MYSQNDSDISSFIVEWYDSNANTVKTFKFKYYSDGNVEMNNTKDGSKFLAKGPYPALKPEQLYIGSVITIWSRQLNIVDYGDERTRTIYENQRGRTLGVVTPTGYNQLGEVLIAAHKAGLTVSQLKMIKLHAGEVADFERICQRDCEKWSEDVIVAMELVDNSPNSCSETWASEVEKINSKYGNQLAYAADQGTALAEANFMFNSDKDARPSPAEYDNCTLAVVRPEAVQRGCAGQILDTILSEDLEICGVEMYQLTSQQADDFFKPYRNVLNSEYQRMIDNMTSGPCIALCVRGNDIVNRFREMCGPIDVELARELYPDSLRAVYGVKGTAQNAIHCTDLPGDGELECRYWFDLMNK
jgi:nucleoside-diphosphate kinase